MRSKKILILTVAYIILSIGVFLAIGPLYTVLRTSFQETVLLLGNVKFEFTLENYIQLLTKTHFLKWTLNTIIFSITVTVLKVFMDTMAGYAFARYRFPGSNAIFGTILVSMMVPFAVIMYPTFLIANRLGMYNTYFGLIIPMLAQPFGIFLMRQFILSIPVEIEDAARIDGCSELGVLTRVIMPLSKPGAAVLAIVTFMWQWTMLLWPLVITGTDEMRTLTVGLASIPSQHEVNWGLMTAGSFMSVLPIIVFFLFYQRGFIQGLTMGAVKE
ncbi:MAG: carbohydrate ABC transporter permease [Actinobacteria bacterium]|nr:carbohydrate ABC transporter permease [Actinomycetota bacterium]